MIGDKIVIASKESLDTEVLAVREEAAKVESMANDIKLSGYGYTKRVPKKDRWESTDIPNTLVDKVLDPIRFSDGLAERTNGTVRLPAAPFAGIADELLSYGDGSDPQGDTDNTNRGVTTVHAHKSGDIVHVGNGAELVTGDSATFTDGIGDWELLSGDAMTHNDTVKVGVLAADTFVTLKDIPGKNLIGVGFGYKVSFTLGNMTNQSVQLFADGTTSKTVTTNGVHTVATHANNNSNIYIRVTAGDAGATVDNISVTPVEQTFQATTDAPAGTLVTADSYQSIDYVTNTSVILLTKQGYMTMRGIHTFAPQASNREIAEAYGWSFNKGLIQVSGLELTNSDGELVVYTGEAVIAGLVPSLNSGAYSPAFNVTGSRKFSDDKMWYETADVVNSTYDCLKD